MSGVDRWACPECVQLGQGKGAAHVTAGNQAACVVHVVRSRGGVGWGGCMLGEKGDCAACMAKSDWGGVEYPRLCCLLQKNFAEVAETLQNSIS